MVSQMDELEAMTQRIEDVFANGTYPGDDQLVCDDAGHEWLDDPDEHRLKNAVKGKHWKEIIPVIVNPTFSDSIFYFTPKAFHYYFPAYLTAVLEFDDNTVFIYSVISAITPGTVRFKGFLKEITPEEKDVIRGVLEYVYRTRAQDDELLKAYLETALLFWSNPHRQPDDWPNRDIRP